MMKERRRRETGCGGEEELLAGAPLPLRVQTAMGEGRREIRRGRWLGDEGRGTRELGDE